MRYLLFSLVAAFFLLVGFALMHAATGTALLTTLRAAGPGTSQCSCYWLSAY